MDTKFVSMISGVRQVHPPVSPSQQPAGKPASASSGPERTAEVDDKAPAAPTTAARSEKPSQDEEPERASLTKVVEELNRNIQQQTRALIFTIDERHGKPIVSVVDKETDKVIRQIPSEVALQVADALEEATGALVSEHA